MIELELARLVRAAIEGLREDLDVDVPEVEITRPRQKEHGDYATNVALAIGAAAGRNPREIAEALVGHLPESDLVTRAEVAGPGFINFTLAHGWLYAVLEEIRRLGPRYGRSEAEEPQRVQIEFVSANPTGPLHVGHARNAVLGDALANVLEAAGHRVEREYYYNDTGRQMELFTASVEARYLELHGRTVTFPEEGYPGTYIAELARDISTELGDSLIDLPPDERIARIKEEAERRIFDWIRRTLDRFRVRFDSWFSERSLHESGEIDRVVSMLRESGHAYDEAGAVWFRSTAFGDDKDRVLIRSNGRPTYFAADCAYVLDKFGRGFDHLVYVWGADHHGDVVRVKGAAQALGFDREAVELLLYQFVSFTRGGRPVPMSKRTGDVITLDELLDEVGTDAARYTLLTRSSDSRIEFDIELVTRQSMDNPVYYVQYAHARIASLIRYAEDQGSAMAPFDEIDPKELVHETELDLLRKLADLPEQVRVAAALRAPYRLTRYAEELAADFHRFYTECRVVTEDASLTQARLHLAAAAKQGIGNILALLGVSAPETMERLEDEG
ncbi:MAG: arginine--tRNA ligase [Actinomycetota bacterium]